MNYGGIFDADTKEKRLNELLVKTNDSSFWTSAEKDSVMLEIKDLKNTLDLLNEVKDKLKNNLEILELLELEFDEELLETIENDYQLLLKQVESLELELLLTGEYDKNNCLMEIHAGAGGTESQDWANMLYRMYTRYLKIKNYEVKELDKLDGEEAGIKSVTFMINGKNAYGYLKNERGVHRLVRISPFDANKRRHTSFASVEVIPEIDKTLEININPSDLKIDVFHSSGAGGQSVNTTDSAVRITHLPTNIVVTCQNERSQLQNKEKALEILKSKLLKLELEKQNELINENKKSQKSINFGSQKRNYVMCPYTLVKDQETGYETSDVYGVLDGDLDEFINIALRQRRND